MTSEQALEVLPDAVERLLHAFDTLDGADSREAALEALREARHVRMAVEPLAIAAGNFVRDQQALERASTRVQPRGRRRRPDADEPEWSASDEARALAEELV